MVSFVSESIYFSFLTILCSFHRLAQTQDLHKISEKGLEAAVSLAQSLMQWSLLIIAGSVVILVGTGYHRPPKEWMRKAYLLFVVGWSFLGLSMYKGVLVQRAYLGYLYYGHEGDLSSFRAVMNHDGRYQILFMELGLAVFGIWLALYLLWWVFAKKLKDEAG